MPSSTISPLRFVASISIALFALATIAMPAAQAQTLNVLHRFAGSPSDGGGRQGTVAVDQAGNVYGAAPDGGQGCGAIGECGFGSSCLTLTGRIL